MMEKTPLYEGKAKQIFAADEPDHYVMHFKDQATAFDGAKKAEVEKKGKLNQKISAKIFEYLHQKGIESHYVKTLSENEMLVKAVDIIMVEVVVRNIAAGSLCRRLGIEEKLELNPPLVELFYKNDELHDPLMRDDHVRLMNLATDEEVAFMKKKALEVNTVLKAFFLKIGILLVDYKLEFGRTKDGKLLLADEITPDGCRLWDAETLKVMDKDRFRKDMGGFMEAYEEILARLEKELA